MGKSIIGNLITLGLSFIFIVVGLSSILLLASTTTMQCDRLSNNDGTCIIKTQKILRKIEKKIEIKNLFKASVDKRGKLNKVSFNIIIDTAIGEIDLLPNYTKQNEDLYDIKDKINIFINQKEMKTLIVKKEQTLLAYIFGCSFIIFGFILISVTLFSLLKGPSRNIHNQNSIRR